MEGLLKEYMEDNAGLEERKNQDQAQLLDRDETIRQLEERLAQGNEVSRALGAIIGTHFFPKVSRIVLH